MKKWSTKERDIDLSHPVVVGILNVTPDSFSDGGEHEKVEEAVCCALEMEREGAEIIDIGGESTRPGATEVEAAEEMGRVLPVVEAIRRVSHVALSIDTRHAVVAEATLKAGANIVNDVSSLADEKMAEVVRDFGAGLVLMHGYAEHVGGGVRGAGEEKGIIERVVEKLEERIAFAEAKGIGREKIVIDPGFGFGKTTEENLELLRGLSQLKGLGLPLFIGLSRKRFIGEVSGVSEVKERDEATVKASMYAISQGAALVRVHAPGLMRSHFE